MTKKHLVSATLPLVTYVPLLLGLINLVGCDSAPTGQTADGVLVFAAASTTDAFSEIKDRFEKQSSAKLRINHASSSALAHQILHGAEAEVFISANTEWADALEKQGFVEQRRDLLGNQLALVVRSDADFRPECLEDLVDRRVTRVAIADPDGVPAGIYAKQALNNVGVWDRVEDKLILGVHVRQTLAHVEQGGADVGIVYATDAAISESVDLAAKIEPELTEPVRYPVLLLKSGAMSAGALRLYEFLASEEAAVLFREYGFLVAE